MEPCCCADDYARMFGRSAAREAKTFRRRGPRGTAADLARAIARTGVDGASILEVGGGVGGLHVHLLERGAASAVHPADAMLASLSRRGFRVCFDEVGMMWRSVVMARAVR